MLALGDQFDNRQLNKVVMLIFACPNLRSMTVWCKEGCDCYVKCNRKKINILSKDLGNGYCHSLLVHLRAIMCTSAYPIWDKRPDVARCIIIYKICHSMQGKNIFNFNFFMLSLVFNHINRITKSRNGILPKEA